MTSERRFHQDTRVSENFTKDGLETLTGQSTGDWSLDDVEARPYQEISDDEMRERVRQLRDTEEKHE